MKKNRKWFLILSLLALIAFAGQTVESNADYCDATRPETTCPGNTNYTN